MRFAANYFTDLETAPFEIAHYSALKFGSSTSAKKLGYELADKFLETNLDLLKNNLCVVIPSAFNVVEIAATILAKHFMNRLNDRLTRLGIPTVEWTTMHRSMSYVQDYSYMSAEERQKLLAGDKLFINKDFIAGKTILFVDDVSITGTHEDKIERFLLAEQLRNQHLFLYYAQYTGHQANIEAKLNHSGIVNVDQYVQLAQEPNHQMVVRAVRFLLDAPIKDLETALNSLPRDFVDRFYHACLAKGYHLIPEYQAGFQKVRARYDLCTNTVS